MLENSENRITEHYLDNSATTKPSPKVINSMLKVLEGCYGNPSSLHTMGLRASEALNDARISIAKSIGADRDEIFFTSGGTESNNLALLGTASSHKRGGKIITTAIEHPSVYDSAKRLEAQGIEVCFLKPDKFGRVNVSDIMEYADEKTFLISMMLVNNELGAIEPVAEIKPLLKRAGLSPIVHCDAVQAYGKLPISVKKLSVDLLTVSSHKIHGPKGVGALYIKKGTKITPRIFGGLQESPYRPGTENMPGIVGFGTAASEIDFNDGVKNLNEYLRQRLAKEDGITINSSEDALPHIMNISVSGLRSEVILNYLSALGIYVSSGSACSKGKRSRVLSECGIAPANIDGAVRISFSKYNTREDVDALVEALHNRRSK